jgi:ABC-type Fe3+-hydroxamate transport system substrate-binding protein
MQRRLILGILAASVAMAAAGCGTSSAAPSQSSTATIAGTFRIEGGPYPGINRPLSGEITIHTGSATGRVVARVDAVAGRFQVKVPPGRYVAVGQSERVGGIGCQSSVGTASANHTVHLAVSCDVP